MLPKFKPVLILSLILAACTGNHNQESNTSRQSHSSEPKSKNDSGPNQKVTINLVETDTLIITSKAAVFFQPDSGQIEKRKKEVGEEDFYIGADDYMYYLATSNEFLEKQKLPVIHAKDIKYLKFIMSDKKEKIIKLDTLDELWGIYLFDPRKKPYYADMTMIAEDYQFYYK